MASVRTSRRPGRGRDTTDGSATPRRRTTNSARAKVDVAAISADLAQLAALQRDLEVLRAINAARQTLTMFTGYSPALVAFDEAMSLMADELGAQAPTFDS